MALLSFQLNYALSGLSPLSYRLVNVALHVVNALLVWRILAGFYRETPLPAMVGGLFFLVHPVQTQAVTYIVQRQSCLATFFVLLTVCTYLRMHEAPDRVPRQAWYVMSLLCAALAIWTKQNTVVIPLLLLLVDRLLQPGTAFRLRPALLRLLPFMLLAVAAVVQQFAVSPAIIAELSEKERLLSAAMTGAGGEADWLPLRYFVTQWTVFWVYIKLVIFPVGQRLDYSWPLVAQLLDGKSILALAGLMLAGVALWRLRFWNPRTLFALAWIALSLAVESSFLPLEPLYEHRLYLPMLGVAMLFIDGAVLRLRPGWQRPAVLVLLVVLSLLTWQRNALWADPIAFWSDNQTKVPYSGRVMSNLAKAYADRGDYASAQQWYASALRANPADGMSMAGLGNALLRQNKTEEARPLLLASLKSLKASPVEMCSTAGALFAVGERSVAMELFQRALTLDADNLLCLHNSAVAFARLNRPAEAEASYRRGLALEPDNAEFLLGLGVLRLESGAYAEALVLLAPALSQSPDDGKILYYGAIAACFAGDAVLCEDYSSRLQARDPSRYAKFMVRIQGSPSRLQRNETKGM